jgi:hypothetical protein
MYAAFAGCDIASGKTAQKTSFYCIHMLSSSVNQYSQNPQEALNLLVTEEC